MHCCPAQPETVIPVKQITRSSNLWYELDCETYYLDIISTMCGLRKRRFLNKALLD